MVGVTDDQGETTFAELLGPLTNAPLDDDVTVESVFALINATAVDGEAVWSGRNDGTPFSSEELVGALEGLTASIRRDLADHWSW